MCSMTAASPWTYHGHRTPGDTWVKLNNCTVKVQPSTICSTGSGSPHGDHWGATLWAVIGILAKPYSLSNPRMCISSWMEQKSRPENIWFQIAIVNDVRQQVPDDMKLKCYGVNAVIASGDLIRTILSANDDLRTHHECVYLEHTVKALRTDAFISLVGSKLVHIQAILPCAGGRCKSGAMMLGRVAFLRWPVRAAYFPVRIPWPPAAEAGHCITEERLVKSMVFQFRSSLPPFVCP